MRISASWLFAGIGPYPALRGDILLEAQTRALGSLATVGQAACQGHAHSSSNHLSKLVSPQLSLGQPVSDFNFEHCVHPVTNETDVTKRCSKLTSGLGFSKDPAAMDGEMVTERPDVYPNRPALDARQRPFRTELTELDAHRPDRLGDGQAVTFCQLAECQVPGSMAFAFLVASDDAAHVSGLNLMVDEGCRAC
jgi:hypothetical protein